MFNFVSIILLVITAKAQQDCSSQMKCRDCISHSVLCSWCISPIDPGHKKCILNAEIKKYCPPENIVNPTLSISYNQNKNFSSETSSVVQIRPQEITIKTRRGHQSKFSFFFQPADNFPVDLYFVMDTSNTMSHTRNTLADLIKSTTTKIGLLTNAYRIGFGSFVDKPIEPFTSTHPNLIDKPCTGCVAAYGFRNHLNLTQDTQLFKRLMWDMQSSGNVDPPEGGFDALVQAVACKDIIGWRETSRKILLFFTDGPYHYAGDGKLAGILEPNDMKCHLDLQGYYTMTDKTDYPSISQLSKLLVANRMSLILATTHANIKIYQRLGKHIEGSYVGEITNDPSSMDELIYDNYNAIQSSISFKVSGFDSSALNITLTSSCDHGSREETTNSCEKVKIGQKVKFTVFLRPKQCLEGVQRVTIQPVGIEESLVLNVETLCDCPCADQAVTSPLCSNKGKLVCGVCECDAGFYGESCGCRGSEEDEFYYCRSDKSSQPSSPVCSGRGDCECGECRCRQVKEERSMMEYTGKYCQCSNEDCRFDNGPVCSGHGVCDCDKCKCEKGFKGRNCECNLDTVNCTAANGRICNGKGDCECGRCDCNRDLSYKGPLCEDCPTCQGRCKLLVECVSCRLNNYQDCISQCGGHDNDADHDHDDAGDNRGSYEVIVELVEELPVADAGANELSCLERDKDACTLSYIYKPKSNSVKALRSKDCPEGPNMYLIIGTTVGGVVLMGVIGLVVWKVVVTVYDRQEFQALENEARTTKWTAKSNPIYRNAVSSFENPTFVGSRARM